MKRLSNPQGILRGPLLPQIFIYTVPIMLTSILQLLFNAADLVVVGRFCGSVSVAAVGATSSITNLIVNLLIGLSIGAGVTISQAYGAENHNEVHRTVHTAILIAIVGGLFLTVIGVLFSDTFLALMDTPKDVLPLSAVYMRIYFGGMVFTMLYNFCAAILRAVGDTKSPLISLFIAGFINVLLNIVFVIVFDMDVAGVALATVISQAISATLVLISLMKRNDCCKFVIKKIRFYKSQLICIIKYGLPAGIQSSLFSLSNVLIQSSINSFGANAVSGASAAHNIDGFVYVCLNAFHHTALNFVGQNYGAKQHRRVMKVFWLCLASVTVIISVLGFLVYSFGQELLSIYITDSPEAIKYGMIRLSYICLPYFVCGLMEVTTGALRGLGMSIMPMAITVLGVCGLRIVWIETVFKAVNTLECLYLSYLVTWVITFIAQFIAFLIIYKKKAEV